MHLLLKTHTETKRTFALCKHSNPIGLEGSRLHCPARQTTLIGSFLVFRYFFLSGLFFLLFSTSTIAQVDFNIRLLSDSVTYQVSLRPRVSWNPPLNITNSAQVTVVVPTGGFQASALTSLKGNWKNNATVVAPVENPNFDYFSFALSGNTTAIAYQTGVEVPLFRFRNAGTCTGDLMLIDNHLDPFMPPNMLQVAVGNAISVLAGGPTNAYRENYDIGLAPCDPNGCSNGWNDAWLPDTLILCAGDTADLMINVPSGSYVWSPTTGLSCSDCTNPRFFPDVNTRYVLSQIRPDGCLTSDTLLVRALSVPSISAVATKPDSCGIGIGTAKIENPNGPYTYSLNGQNWQKTRTFSNLIAGNYTAYVRDTLSSCFSTKTFQIAAVFCDTFCVDAWNDAWLPDSLQVCAGQNLLMNVMVPPNSTVLWSPSTGVDCPTCAATHLSPTTSTNYTFSLQKSDGCFIKDTLHVEVHPLPSFTSVLVKPDSCSSSPSGSISITGQGQHNVEYSINGGGIWQSSGQFTNLPVGDYWVWMRDAVTGCAKTYVGNPLKIICTQAPVGKISGFAFLDCNALGTFNSLEYLIPQVPVLLQGLTPTGDSITQISQTDAFGFYGFDNLPTGVYTVRFDTILGAGFSPQNAILNDTLDSDVNSFSGETFGIFLPPGGHVAYTAAGYWDTLAPSIVWANPSLAHLAPKDTIWLECSQTQQFSAQDIKATDLAITDAPVTSVNRISVPLSGCNNGLYKLEKIQWLATDVCGNVANLAIFVAYIDTLAPVLTDIPPDLMLAVGAVLMEADTLLAADDCTGIAAWAFAENPIFTDCQADIYRTWAATDVCGNMAFAQQHIQQALSITALETVSPETCAGNDGEILMYPSDLLYEWSSGESSEVLFDLDQGFYDLRITDKETGCVEQREIEVKNNCKCISPTPSQICIFQANCDEYDGGITIRMDESPFRYDWLWSPDLGKVGADPAQRTKLPPSLYDIHIITPFESTCITRLLIDVPEFCDSTLNPFQVDSIQVPLIMQQGSKADTSMVNALLFPPLVGGVVEVKTGISPNGDGLNDALVLTYNPKEHIDLRIFSRWGLQVYHSEHYLGDWKGMWEGQRLPTGVYFLLGQSQSGRRYEGWVFLE